MSQCHFCHGIDAMSLLILAHSWILVGILLQLQLPLPQSMCAVPHRHWLVGFGCSALALCEFYVSLIVCYLPSWLVYFHLSCSFSDLLGTWLLTWKLSNCREKELISLQKEQWLECQWWYCVPISPEFLLLERNQKIKCEQ